MSINSDIKGIIGNSIPQSELKWNVAETTKDMIIPDGNVSSPVQSFVATVQDPMLLYIAVACFVVFIVILCFSVWRLWENRTQKL